ncbi:MAG: SEL1-like repeat protein [Oscillospiraceae bacterium]|nr:SEL1-like repeat protein [Oscillospiraceae bacterium]
MAKLILKSPYFKCGGAANVSGYMSYIATREHVQRIADDRPTTRKQEQLIANLLQDFPDTKALFEFENWSAAHTKHAASALITTALEMNWDAAVHSDIYMKYIAVRPRAERFGTHGLFGDDENIDLEQAMSELDAYTGNVWTHIISLHREDAVRLGYDSARVWRDLLKTHRNEIAEAMKIPLKNFRWYAAFHDEGEHPHVHMMAWSSDSLQGYLNSDGIRTIRSRLTNDIFRQEMLHIYEQKSQSRDELTLQARKAMSDLVREMQNGICNYPEAEQLIMELSQQLESIHGKKQYGYLPKKLKTLVDEIIDQMERLPVVAECYARWLELQEQVQSYYSGNAASRLPLSQQMEFRAIKNAVIQEAESVRLGDITFEDADIQHDEKEDDRWVSTEYWYLRDTIYDNSVSLNERNDAVIEMKKLAEDGNSYAQYLLGKNFRDGIAVIPDWVEARYWFQQAANHNMAVSQYALGKLCLTNDVEVRDPEQGLRWLKSAAQNGSHYAAYRLAKEYLKGEITEKNVPKALDYLDYAARAGNPFAQYMLGKLYLTGKEVPADKEQALYWLTLSADHGNQYAQFFLARQSQFNPPSVMLAATRLLHHMGNIFRDHSLPPKNPLGMQIDSKRRRRLTEKRIAMGHKPNDHEEYHGQTMSM